MPWHLVTCTLVYPTMNMPHRSILTFQKGGALQCDRVLYINPNLRGHEWEGTIEPNHTHTGKGHQRWFRTRSCRERPKARKACCLFYLGRVSIWCIQYKTKHDTMLLPRSFQSFACVTRAKARLKREKATTPNDRPSIYLEEFQEQCLFLAFVLELALGFFSGFAWLGDASILSHP